MLADILVSTKDIMALSDVSERTAMRRRAHMKKMGSEITLRFYCACYGVKYKTALEYVIGKRYDPIHFNRIKRGEILPNPYEIHIWEESYISHGKVQKILFQEFILLEPDGRTSVGLLRYFTLPEMYRRYYKEFSIEILNEFDTRALPFDDITDKEKLLEFYGFMVLKREKQASFGFVVDIKVQENRHQTMAYAMRKKFRYGKKIWFAKTDIFSANERETMGFQEIEGSGFSISGVPGFDRKGKVNVRLHNGDA